jgi:hypothetical protein
VKLKGCRLKNNRPDRLPSRGLIIVSVTLYIIPLWKKGVGGGRMIQFHFFELSLSQTISTMRAICDTEAKIWNKQQIIYRNIRMMLIITEMLTPFFMRESCPDSIRMLQKNAMLHNIFATLQH